MQNIFADVLPVFQYFPCKRVYLYANCWGKEDSSMTYRFPGYWYCSEFG
jgi:hypothetical protein